MHTTVHPTPKTICLGLDIAKAKLDACLLHNGTHHRAQSDNTPAGLRALLALEHKLLRHAFALLKHQSAYDPNHHPLKPL